MKPFSLSFSLLLGGLALLAGGSCVVSGTADGTATVLVVVEHEPLGAPVGGVAVEVDYRVEGMASATLSGVTGNDGRARFAVAAPALVSKVRAICQPGAPAHEREVGIEVAPGSYLRARVAFPVAASTTAATAAARAANGELALADGRPGAVRVQVVWEHSGEPAAGVPVQADFVPLGTDGAFTVEARTGSDGAALLSMPAPARLDRLRARPTDSTPRALLRLFDAVLPGLELRYELRLPQPGALTGRLVDESGAPVAGVELWGWTAVDVPLQHALLGLPVERRAVSGADGRFRFEGVGGMLFLYAQGDGIALPGPLAATCAGGRTLDLGDLEMRRQRILRGRVIRTDGSGIGDTGLWVTQSLRDKQREEQRPDLIWITGSVPRYVVADSNGRFQVPVIAGHGGTIRTEHPDFAVAGLDFGPLDDELTVRLYQPRKLSGRVVDSNGQPVAATVRMTGQERSSVWTGPGGHFSLPLRLVEPFSRQAGEGAYRLEVAASGCARQVLLLDRLPLEPQPIEVVLQQPQELRIRVVDAAGNPVPGASLTIIEPGELREDPGACWKPLGSALAGRPLPIDALGRAWTEQPLRTDALGRYCADDWPSGKWLVRATSPRDRREPRFGLAESGGEELVIVLGGEPDYPGSPGP